MAGPIRTCVGCRERDLRSVLLRVVAGGLRADEPYLVVDAGRSMPGRGAWLHATTRCLELAERRRSLPRALRIAASVDVTAVRAYLAGEAGPVVASTGLHRLSLDCKSTEHRHESGLEADGHPMSTQR